MTLPAIYKSLPVSGTSVSRASVATASVARASASSVSARPRAPALLLFSLAIICSCFISNATNAQNSTTDTSPLQTADTQFSDSEIALIKLFGPWPPTVPQDAGNELSGLLWAETLGEKLFNDPALSAANNLSCASCHRASAGFAENLSVAVGAAKHVRNTQGLLNAGLQRWYGWDGGADSLWAATLRPILSDIEMASDIEMVAARFRNRSDVVEVFQLNFKTFETTTRSDEQFVVLLAKSIAAYTRTLVSTATTFDNFRTALLTDNASVQQAYPLSAKRGLKLFLGEANCHVCHFGANFSNGEFHDTGRPFFTAVGKIDSGRYHGIKRVRNDRYNLPGKFNGVDNDQSSLQTATVKLSQVNFGQWRTPSLRNLTLTAPYMHDGSLPTLRDVVDAYAEIDPQRLHAQGESILKPLDLDHQSRNDLVRFLETLSEPANP